MFLCCVLGIGITVELSSFGSTAPRKDFLKPNEVPSMIVISGVEPHTGQLKYR